MWKNIFFTNILYKFHVFSLFSLPWFFFGGGGWGDEDDIGFVFNKYGFCVQVYIWIYKLLDDADVHEEFYSLIWRCHGKKDVDWTVVLS